jgi:hypothetical protein
MQFLTYFWRFRQCHVNFMPFASSLQAAVAFCRATFSASDSFAASAGVGTNAMPLSTAAIMPAIKAVAKWFMIPSLEPLIFTPDPPIIFAMVSEIDMIPSFELLLFIHPRATLFLAFKPLDYTRRQRKPWACRGFQCVTSGESLELSSL